MTQLPDDPDAGYVFLYPLPAGRAAAPDARAVGDRTERLDPRSIASRPRSGARNRPRQSDEPTAPPPRT
jgi:hypothetical protein